MQTKNLNEVVKKALLYAGCDPSLIQELDNHSTVKIDLKETASMYIGKSEDIVVIWSDLCEFHESLIPHLSEQVLEEITSDFFYGRDEQLMLRESEGQLQLYVEVQDQYLDDPQSIAETMNSFFERQSRLMEIIRQ